MKLTIQDILLQTNRGNYVPLLKSMIDNDEIVDTDIDHIKFLCSYPSYLDLAEMKFLCKFCITRLNIALDEIEGVYPYKFLGVGASGYVIHVKSNKNCDFNATVKISKKHKRVENEIEILEKLSNCSYVPKLLFSSVVSSVNYVVTEFLSGYDVLVNLKKRHDTILIGRIIRNLIDGLNELHSNGVAHRDIKPHNIMYNSLGHIKFIDFDLSYSLPKPKTNDPQSPLSPLSFPSLSSVSEEIIDFDPSETDIRSELTIGGTFGYCDPKLVNLNYVKVTFNDLVKGDYWSLGMTIIYILTGKDSVDVFDIKDVKSYNLREFKSKSNKINECVLEIFETLEDINKNNSMCFTLIDLITLESEKRSMKY